MAYKLAVFTLVMPDVNKEDVPRVVGDIGYDGVEWRVARTTETEVVDYWSGNRATLDESNILEEARLARKLCDQHGLEVPALGTYLNVYSEAGLVERVLEAADILGAQMVRVSPPSYDGKENYRVLFERAVLRYRELLELFRRRGKKALVEVHHGGIVPSASAAYRLVSNFSPEFIGVLLDPGNMVFEGYESWQLGAELLADYVAHVHVKNARWERRGDSWAVNVCPLEEGVVDWKDVIGALRKINYNGYLSLEDFSESGLSTEAKLRKDHAFLNSLLAE
jgi:sugar phosphate isomerase/epimerase